MGNLLRLRLLVLTLALCLIFILLSPEQKIKRPFSLATLPQKETPWPIQIGLRIATLRANVATVNRVVVVPDEATFLAAIKQWSLQGRWPILIEDSQYTPMFIQRFQPAEVIRLPAVSNRPTGSQLRESMLSAVAAAWDATDGESLRKTWEQLGWQPPGVAIASSTDPAWPAAVALAADRGQPLVFLEDNFGSPNDRLNSEQWQSLKTTVQNLVKNTGYPYAALGDAIDTITIVRQLAVKYQSPTNINESLAVTDGLARDEAGNRWAVASWIYGSPARSVYQAMCSIFIDSKNALFYDSYPKEMPWLYYEMDSAASQLTQVGLNVKLVQQPEAGLVGWRKLTANPLNFDLVFVNSKGDKASFDVGNGSASVQDVPKLNTPAAVHFLHSFSATTPDDRDTVAGRWLENGAYVYVGSVDEPYLTAFIPPKLMVRRIILSVPFLIAARQLESPPWKITTIGDPLMMITKPRQRISPNQLPMVKVLE